MNIARIRCAWLRRSAIAIVAVVFLVVLVVVGLADLIACAYRHPRKLWRELQDIGEIFAEFGGDLRAAW